MLTLIIAEAALETVPEELWRHPSVVKHARSKGKQPREVLLDRSYHHAAMLKLKDGERRGRPDLVHLALLEATATPLWMKGGLEVFVHTMVDEVISLSRGVRLPKSHFRFEGLMEKLFKEREAGDGEVDLLKVKRLSFQMLLSRIEPSLVIGLSRVGRPTSLDRVVDELSNSEKPVVVIGGFPRRHFSPRISPFLNQLCSIHKLPLEAHIVISRLIYEYEKRMNASKQ